MWRPDLQTRPARDPDDYNEPSMPGPFAIEFDRVGFVQPSGVRVLDDLTLAIRRGEVIALVGRSGAGKTTLLRLINRLALPQQGRVLVGARDTREWDPIALRRSIGYVIQDVGLFPHMTVAGNIAVVPRLERWEPARIAARVAELLDLVGLTAEHGERWPAELSGGQRQRVGVARALAADPAVLLMDEPFGALDPLTRAELQHEFRGIQQRVGKTVVIVTHDMLEALALADRVAVLDRGLLIACEPPETIVESEHPDVRRLLDAVLPHIRASDRLGGVPSSDEGRRSH
jgi:osmoprotectant transport system ATP-binding protein